MFFVLLFFPFLLFCNVIVTQNDPSSLVEGVSVITGHFYTCEEDYVVQGSEPIRWQRSQISGAQTNSDFIHLFAFHIPATNIFSVPEKNGTTFWYQPHPKIKQRYNILLKSGGITNTASGKVSAQTNLKNQHLSLNQNGKKFTLHCANGTKKYYEELKNQIPSDLGLGQKGFITYNYKLVHEELPNGNKINYCWNDQNQLETIYTTNPRHTKIYATLHLPRISPNQFTPRLKLTGSDGRYLIYESTPIGNKTYGLRDIVCPDFPKLHLDYEIREKKIKLTPCEYSLS